MIRPILALICAFLASAAFAQTDTAPTIKVTLPKTAKPGSVVKGTVEVTFADGLHGYQNPPTEDFLIPVKVSVDTKGYSLKATYPKGIMKSIGGDPKPAGVYEGTIKIPVSVTVPKAGGNVEVKFTVSYQQCNDTQCYAPGKVSSTVKLKIAK